MPKWTAEEFGRNLHRVTFDLHGAKSEQWIFLMSDVHFDSTYCDRDLLTRHLDEAKRRGAIVLDCGDFFDMMQGKRDRRAAKEELRPEYVGLKGKGYFDAVIEDGASFLEPYKDHIALMGVGNHESAVNRMHERNVTQALVDRLRIAGSKVTHVGGYGGYVVARALVDKSSSKSFRSVDIRYFHGSGGGGQVTRDMIAHNRQAANAETDIYWSGHVHQHWDVNTSRQVRTKDMVVKKKPETHIRTPGYKDEYEDGFGGWAVESGHGPRSLGGYWLRFYQEDSHNRVIGWDAIAAK